MSPFPQTAKKEKKKDKQTKKILKTQNRYIREAESRTVLLNWFNNTFKSFII